MSLSKAFRPAPGKREEFRNAVASAFEHLVEEEEKRIAFDLKLADSLQRLSKLRKIRLTGADS